MAYLIDTNVFIQAKNQYYDFEVCPGFWDWLVAAHQKGRVFSIEQVRVELMKGQDKLADWTKDRNRRFFLKVDDPFAAQMRVVVRWAQKKYAPPAVADFVGCADSALVAFALAHNHTVVTHETSRPAKTATVKIPDACHGTGAKVMSAVEMLRKEKARFVLE